MKKRALCVALAIFMMTTAGGCRLYRIDKTEAETFSGTELEKRGETILTVEREDAGKYGGFKAKALQCGYDGL